MFPSALAPPPAGRAWDEGSGELERARGAVAALALACAGSAAFWQAARLLLGA
jgi:hypothetical protein